MSLSTLNIMSTCSIQYIVYLVNTIQYRVCWHTGVLIGSGPSSLGPFGWVLLSGIPFQWITLLYSYLTIRHHSQMLQQRTPTSSSAAPNTTLGSFLVASSSEQAANVPPPADEFAPAEVPADESAAPVSAAANGADASAEEPALPDAAATNNASEPQP